MFKTSHLTRHTYHKSKTGSAAPPKQPFNLQAWPSLRCRHQMQELPLRSTHSILSPCLDNSIYSLAPPMDIRRESSDGCTLQGMEGWRYIDIKRILSIRRSAPLSRQVKIPLHSLQQRACLDSVDIHTTPVPKALNTFPRTALSNSHTSANELSMLVGGESNWKGEREGKSWT